ncbi:MAG: RHS repeat-associated core domain-containing protein [Myxococcales bacterium]|nr:MAG: RHS repeat-associated core domain-containing protein [Myxococcales bacterium]
MGNLLEVKLHAGDTDEKTISYVVDAFNRRVGKLVDGAPVQGFLYTARRVNPVAELDGQGRLASLFVYGTRSNVPDYMIKYNTSGQVTGTFAIMTDHLGSPRLVVDVQTGVVAQALEYNEFGMVESDSNPGFQPFGFAGGLYDADTGLLRFGWRDYDPEAGRWTAKDPILFAGGDVNLYGYVLGDPVNFLDPWGLTPVADEGNKLICKYGDAALAMAELKRSSDPQNLFNAQVEYYVLMKDVIEGLGNWKWAGFLPSLYVGSAYIWVKAGIQTVFNTPNNSPGGFDEWYAFLEGLYDATSGVE